MGFLRTCVGHSRSWLVSWSRKEGKVLRTEGFFRPALLHLWQTPVRYTVSQNWSTNSIGTCERDGKWPVATRPGTGVHRLEPPIEPDWRSYARGTRISRKFLSPEERPPRVSSHDRQRVGAVLDRQSKSYCTFLNFLATFPIVKVILKLKNKRNLFYLIKWLLGNDSIRLVPCHGGNSDF